MRALLFVKLAFMAFGAWMLTRGFATWRRARRADKPRDKWLDRLWYAVGLGFAMAVVGTAMLVMRLAVEWPLWMAKVSFVLMALGYGLALLSAPFLAWKVADQELDSFPIADPGASEHRQ
jgi:ABC-type uncharacterized transport system YnjBCD permease subunit